MEILKPKLETIFQIPISVAEFVIKQFQVTEEEKPPVMASITYWSGGE